MEILKKCGGCGNDDPGLVEEVRDKKQNRGYLCPSCLRTYSHLLQPDSSRRFWMCAECGFRILAGTKIDAEVDPKSLCPHCGTDVNFSLVNLSGDKPVKTDILGHPED